MNTSNSYIERKYQNRTYRYGTSYEGGFTFMDRSNENATYQADLSECLPPLKPVLTKAGTVAKRQPRVQQRSRTWWKGQCAFRGLGVGGSIAEMQGRIRKHGDAGMSSQVKAVYKSMKEEFRVQKYDGKGDNQKACVWPEKFLEECFGTEGSRKDEVIVVEVDDWGNAIGPAARKANIFCNIAKLSHHQTGQRRVVVGRNQIAVDSKVAELNREETRAAQRAREEQYQEDAREEAEYKREFKAAKSKESTLEGKWNITGSWQIRCSGIESQWDTNNELLTLDLKQTEPTAKGNTQFYGSFFFSTFEGVIRFDSDERNYWFNAKSVPSHIAREFNFRWRGRETGEGEIQLRSDRTLCEIQFHSPHALTGMFRGSFAGDCEFTGIKTSKTSSPGPQEEPEDLWEDYSEAAHEAARIGRW